MLGFRIVSLARGPPNPCNERRRGRRRRAWCSSPPMTTRTSLPARCAVGPVSAHMFAPQRHAEHCVITPLTANPYAIAGQARCQLLPLLSRARTVDCMLGGGNHACMRASVHLRAISCLVRLTTACLQGTIGNEILRETDMDKLDAIFVAVGKLMCTLRCQSARSRCDGRAGCPHAAPPYATLLNPAPSPPSPGQAAAAWWRASLPMSRR